MLESEGDNRASSAKTIAKPEARSRVSNGKDLFLEGVDGRSALARRYRNILAQLTRDIGGGSKHHYPPRYTACRLVRASGSEASGKPLNIGEYATATNTLRRRLLDLGLERRMRDITPGSTPTWRGRENERNPAGEPGFLSN